MVRILFKWRLVMFEALLWRLPILFQLSPHMCVFLVGPVRTVQVLSGTARSCAVVVAQHSVYCAALVVATVHFVHETVCS